MPVYNDIVWTVDSTNKALCSFQYVCDVYVNSIFIKRMKLFPYGSLGYASFKIDGVLKDLLSYDLQENLYGASIFARNYATILDYQLKFGEEYDVSAQCDAGTTVFPNLTNSSTQQAFNGALQYEEWLTWASSNYTMTSVSKKFLTKMPQNVMILTKDQMVVNFINSATVAKLEVKTYSAGNVLFGTYRYNNGITLTDATERILSVGVGPENLNNSTLASGVQPVIHSTVHHYTYQLVNSSNVAVSELRRVDIDMRDTKFPTHRFWFLNRLGGFDSYTYTLMDRRRVDTNITEYNKLYGAYQVASPINLWTYQIGNRGRTVLTMNAQEVDVYNSNWMTEAESLWMEELHTSPEVYISKENNKLCFASAYFIPDGGIGVGDIIKIGFPLGSPYAGLQVGDIVQLNIEDDDMFEINGPNEIVAVASDSFSIVSPIPDPPVEGAYPVKGYALPYGFVSALDPVVLRTRSYEEKKKYRIKNINYTLEVDKAYAINVQKN